MARPQRNNVDYFPFYCEEGQKMYYLEETYGNDGFAVFVKLLRELAKVDYHYLDLSKTTSLMFMSAKCKVSKELLLSIINDLVDLDKFDKTLWADNSIIWCQDFIDSIGDAYTKRSNSCITYNSLLLLLEGKGILKPSKSKSKPLKCISTSPVNPQSILKDSKVNKTIVDAISFNPSIDDIKNYTLEKGYDVDANKIWHYYNDNDWKDARGNDVKNWKTKILNNWCKEEFKIKVKAEPPKIVDDGKVRYKVRYINEVHEQYHTAEEIEAYLLRNNTVARYINDQTYAEWKLTASK